MKELDKTKKQEKTKQKESAINMNLIKAFKSGSKVVYWAVIAFITIVAGVTIYSFLPISNNIDILTVQSGSMEPTIPTGSLVIVKPENEYEVGDVITFRELKKDGNYVTHRIVGVNEDDEYITKGDANEDPDIMPVMIQSIAGRVQTWIPMLGYPVGYAKTYQGLIVMVIIPSTLVIYDEFLSLKQAIKEKFITKTA